MNTRIILSSSSILLALLGIGFTFMPNEIAAYLDMSITTEFRFVLQLLGALYFSYAMLNWTVKGSVMGGIYNRPIALANFTHFLMGALALLKGGMNYSMSVVFWIVCILYVLFAILFGLVLFRKPAKLNT